MSLIEQFEADCRAVGVNPPAALVAGGVDRNLWYKWRDGVSPTVRNLERARAGLAKLAAANKAA